MGAEVESVGGRRREGVGGESGEEAEGVGALAAAAEGLHEVAGVLDGLQFDFCEVEEGLEEDSGRQGVQQVDVVELGV
jgi:hypothetical protein